MGLTLATERPEDKALARRYDKVQRDYDKITGKRPADNLGVRVPEYTDPGKTRAIGALIAERIADANEENKYPQEIGKSHIPGYRTLATNGFYLIAEHGAASETAARTVYPPPTTTWTIGADAWRAYGRVRTCRSERTQRVTWAMGDLGLVLSAADLDIGCQASERIDGVYPDGRIILDDRYLWPLRGVEWTAGLTGDKHTPHGALHLTAWPYLILIMGVRE